MSSSYSGGGATSGGGAWSRYKRIKSIGSGSYGTVYLCQVTDPTSDDFDEYVAIKTVSLEALGDKEASLAMSEVAILRNLNHPHILRFIDCFIDEEHTLCCVTEYVDGGDLSSVIKTAKKQRRLVDAFVVVDMLRQALEGLSYLHSQAVLHRDIKPGNIYVTRGGTVKIGDFGVSKLVSETAPHAVTFIGTPFYLCPELCMGEQYSFGADVWALGITAYELYVLKLPFHASNVLALANIISEGQYDKNILTSRPMPEAQRQELLNSCGPDYVLKTESLGGLVSSLVQAMIVSDPLERPTAHQLLQEFYGISSAPPDSGAFADEHQQMLDELDAELEADSEFVGGDQTSVATSPSATMGMGGGVRRSSIITGLSRASIVAMSRSMEVHQQRHASEGASMAGHDDNNDEGDSVRVGDDEDENDVDTRLAAINVTKAPESSISNNNHNTSQLRTTGWASAYGSVYADPHALERALREKALLYHRKRQEKLKVLRLQEEEKRRQQQQRGNAAAPARCLAPAVAFSYNAYQVGGYARPTSATAAPQDSSDVRASLRDPQALKLARGVARSLVGVTAATGLPLSYVPPRVHFSDDDDDEEAPPVSLKAVVLMSGAPATSSSSSASPSVVISVKKLRTDTTSKKLLKRLRAAIRSQRTLHAEGEGPIAAAEISLWLQAQCPESLDETLAALPFPAWHISVQDGDGDYVSVTSSKEWKQAMRDHVERWNAQRREEEDDDEEGSEGEEGGQQRRPPPIHLRCDVLTSLVMD
ncbi:serine-threonine protein kinase, putative [Bodo saltans]|uniref:non-specific serine/threonine protein kinase n=1 Tax=Bodo saltans TaxID=75058 RepID=A0A0S4JN22_BODSA|nr:serine-threonine protein kinase, putative [Bodo saltans]|eukprot:CUG92930.1 serine-threonine protein kinase, putative [Bodo saltans]